MRFAAQSNVDAAVAAARSVREIGTTRGLRARFYAEAAARGNLGVFMVVNGSSTEVIEEPLREGMAFAIDCVSHCRFYHGDFARTVFVGEPAAQAKRVTRAIEIAWDDIRSQLRAGRRFADVTRIGRESLKKQGVDFNVSFTPHSVGLFHTDHPQASLLSPRGPENLVLEENTVLSVDHPVLESGLGGTMHLEDLTLIRSDGSEPLHTVPPPVLMV
jgi:Xaa-Pro aminopeptidase